MTLDKPKRDLIALRLQLQERYGRSPSYGQLWHAVASGKIPAHREGRCWVVDDADLPAVAEHFQLTTSASTSVA